MACGKISYSVGEALVRIYRSGGGGNGGGGGGSSGGLLLAITYGGQYTVIFPGMKVPSMSMPSGGVRHWTAEGTGG